MGLKKSAKFSRIMKLSLVQKIVQKTLLRWSSVVGQLKVTVLTRDLYTAKRKKKSRKEKQAKFFVWKSCSLGRVKRDIPAVPCLFLLSNIGPSVTAHSAFPTLSGRNLTDFKISSLRLTAIKNQYGDSYSLPSLFLVPDFHLICGLTRPCR